jgi:hypothetical protein
VLDAVAAEDQLPDFLNDIVELPDRLKHESMLLWRVAFDVAFLRKLATGSFFRKSFRPVLSDHNPGCSS